MTTEALSDSASRVSLRVTIASRIFEPEPSAASFRLGVLASTLAEEGHDVTVLTVRPPEHLVGKSGDEQRKYRVKRSKVLRDATGYVRGYLPYLSFDLPLFLRLLFSSRPDVIVAEPPPTTGLFVRLVSALRRVPYVYYAADIWGDGAAQTGAPVWVVRVVRKVERFAMKGATTVLSVSDSLTDRLVELGITDNVLTVGNGVDWRPFFSPDETAETYNRVSPPEFIYAGTASEWHGSTVFIEALPAVLAELPDARVRFIGGGSEFEKIESLSKQLGVSEAVTITPFMPPEELAPILKAATGTLASILPGNGNESTFPTKLYASVLCGVPAIFAGVGPAQDFLRTKLDGVQLGLSVGINSTEVANAMLELASRSEDAEQRMRVVEWGLENVSLSSVAGKIVSQIEDIAAK